jgi:spore germination protein KC
VKKCLCLLISLFLILNLCGCGDTTPLKEKLIIQGIGVDVDKQGFLVTVQVYSPSTKEGDPGKYQMFDGTGQTVYEALKRVDENTGKQSYYSDTKVIVFSHKSLENGLWSNLEYFIRSSEMGSNVCIAVTMGKAVDLLTVENEGVNMPSKLLSNLLHYGKTTSKPISGELMTVSADLLRENADVAIPIVETTKQQGKTYPVHNGVLCFQKGLPRFAMTEQQKWVYYWIHGYYDDRAYVFAFEDHRYSLQFQKTKTKIKVQQENGKLIFAFGVSVECDVMETNSSKGITLKQMPSFTDALEKEIENKTIQTVQEVFVKEKCDVFDLGRALQKYQPDYYKGLTDWRETVSGAEFRCEADVRVERAGQGNVEKG